MNRGIYPILSGAIAHERRMQVFANNMANVNTAGFKQDEQAFQAILPKPHLAMAAPVSPVGLTNQIIAIRSPSSTSSEMPTISRNVAST